MSSVGPRGPEPGPDDDERTAVAPAAPPPLAAPCAAPAAPPPAPPPAQLKDSFELFDASKGDKGDGQLTPSELQDLMLSNGVEISEAELESIFVEMDADDSGGISFLEFAAYMLLQEEQSDEEARRPRAPHDPTRRESHNIFIC